jgi:hypothetical protein
MTGALSLALLVISFEPSFGFEAAVSIVLPLSTEFLYLQLCA